MTPEDVAKFFTRPDGSYRFARWGRPIVPIVFGVDDATLAVVKGAVEAVVTLARHKMAETDPELGANLMIFFFRDWSELTQVPDLDRLIPNLGPLVERLTAREATLYRTFRFDPDGSIKAAFVFVRVGGALAEVPAETLALGKIVQIILLWAEEAFTRRAPLAVIKGRVVLRPEVGDLIRAAYDPLLPPSAEDLSHAYRLAARLA